ncbi:hypothetical protein [Parendozoicomonas sp. Alg238-R29]|uniref:hypothetical protein n=1 Tax=Parendozoicomonas sp. Alg238-R29 TaxID=2993446 RepID=UPI00248E8237|nr:hypothetical protein [Parendozoicomonas sp. Alg238-R29]
MADYILDGGDLNLPALISYEAPAGGNVVIDVASGEVAAKVVAGTIQVNDQPAQRQVCALSFDPQNMPGLGTQRKMLGTATSAADGTFSINVGAFNGPVLVIAVDHYGQTWEPNTTYSIGDTVHPVDPSGYKGFVYDCTGAGVSGPDEPHWWTDTGSNATGTSGTATLTARQYYQPLCHGPIIPVGEDSEE